ncbi:MAG: helix-turn-helix domain-containing protein [Gammaproteobacteria bacterium]
MDSKPIKSEGDYKRALRAIEQLWEVKPVAAIEHCMESRGLTRKDLEPFIGNRARVSEVMATRRPLTLRMIRRLAVGLGIPTDALIQPYRTVDHRAA